MSIEVMRQALDALYDIDATGVPVGHIDLVIDTLRLAIEQAEKQEPVAWMHPDWPTYTRAPSPALCHRENWVPLYTAPPSAGPCHTCVALARAVMCDQTGRA